MEEAERLCDRVAIIDRGQIIALGTPRALIAGIGGEHTIEFALDESGDPPTPPPWAELPGVTDVTCDDGHVQLTVTEPHRVVPALLEQLADAQLHLSSLTTRHTSLEDVFVKLTGRRLDE